jgi:hypothetical protein
MALLVQANPVTQLRTLDTLLNMAQKKGRREAGMAIEALKVRGGQRAAAAGSHRSTGPLRRDAAA